MLTNLKRILYQGWLHFKRQGSLSLAGVLMLSSTLALITMLFLGHGVIKYVLISLQDQLDVSVYFKEEVPEEKILEVQKELSQLPEVKEVIYVSPDEALARFQERYKDNEVIMESLAEIGTNPLLAALNIKVWKAPQYESVVNFLEASRFEQLIESIDYQQNKEVINRMYNITKQVALWGLILSLFLALLAFIIIFNTIRLTIEHAKKEIEVMNLVGADKVFINGPFLVQGVLMGISSALLVTVLFILLIFAVGPKFNAFVSGFNIISYYFTHLGIIFLIQIGIGVGLGVISSWMAVNKYLK